jgi:hypothetical protein
MKSAAACALPLPKALKMARSTAVQYGDGARDRDGVRA